MNYTLRGKFVPTHPYQLDKTLSLEGAGAEAKATGKAIEEVKNLIGLHPTDTSNPHKVSKEQIGLGLVDNTPDSEKPISYAQSQAINEAKQAGLDAQASAENAYNAAQNAQDTANGKVSKKNITVTLSASKWSGNSQSVTANGVTADNDVFVSAAPNSYTAYAESMIRCSAQGKDTLTFVCDEVPTSSVSVNVIIFN